MALTWQQHLGAAVTRVIDARVGSNPYFTVVLMGLVRRECYEIKTLAVTDDGIMLMNPNGLMTMSVEELAAGLVHEVMHVILKHADRAKELGVDADTHEAWNWAADSVINKQLRDSGLTLPEGVIYPEKLGQPDGLTAEESYRLLLQEAQNQPQQGGEGDGGGEGDDEQQGAGDAGGGQGDKQQQQEGGGGSPNGEHGKDVAAGACGSCASGHRGPGEPEKRSDTPDPQARSTADIEAWRRQVAEAIREQSASEASKGRGTIPGDLVRWAEDLLKPPKIDWRTKLGQAVREAVAYKAGMVDLYYGRPSRRQAGVGFGAGRPIMPAYRAPVPNVAVIVDTSGSMGAPELQEAINETAGVLQAVGAPVKFVAIDAQVQGMTEIDNPLDIAKLLKGGGGTRMEPAFELLRNERERPDVVICCTDGLIDDFAEHDWCRTVWVIVGGDGQPNNWGETIVIEGETAREENAA